MKDRFAGMSRFDRTPAAGLPTQLSPQQFAEHFQSSARTLWCVAAAVLGHPSGAEDVLQEAALVGLKRLDRFEPGTSFQAWMSQIVRYTALNQMRSDKKNPHTLEESALIDSRPVTNPYAEDLELAQSGRLHHEREWFDDRVLAALAQLKETPRTCLLLKTILQLEYREIAEMLEIAEGTAASHVHRARERMREILQTGPENPTAQSRKVS